jgi:hypothetical protein
MSQNPKFKVFDAIARTVGIDLGEYIEKDIERTYPFKPKQHTLVDDENLSKAELKRVRKNNKRKKVSNE